MSAVNNISALAVPAMIFVFVVFGLIRKTEVYNAFISGAEEGIATAAKIYPVLLAVLVAVAMLRTSGLLDLAVKLLKPVTDTIGMPGELIPLALLRPVSGGGSIALLSELLSRFGADSLIGRMASVMSGSTETTFYTLAVYYAATRVKRTGYSLPAAVIGDIVGMAGAVCVCNIVFGGA